MAGRMSRRIATLIWALAAVPAWAGQAPTPAVPAPPAGSAVTEPEVLLAPVDSDEKFFVWRSARLQYAVKNGSAPSGIGVRSLKISISPGLGIRVPGVPQADGGVELVPAAFQLRTPAERRDFPPIELKPATSRELGWSIVSVLTYRPRKEAFTATLEYERLADGTVASRATRLILPVAAHPFAMYLGAIFGSLLTALYFVLPPLRPAKPRDATDPPVPSYPLHDLIVRFIRGALVMGIAVFLLQASTDIALPITITVHDFSGGVLLGLFGDKVGEVISKKLWG